MKTKHSVMINWSEQDQVFIATVPEIENLNAFGSTPEEALRELEVAKELILKVMEEDGESIPLPSTYASSSGQLRVRMPKTLHASVAAEAYMEGISLNTYIVSRLSENNAYHKVQRAIEAAKPNLIMVKENTTETDPLDKWFFTVQDKDWSGITPSLMRQRG